MPIRVLLLSPHPDDLAWSLGATVSRLRAVGAELFGLTFFGDSRYAPGDPSHGTADVTAVRAREEDAWAAWAGVRLRRHDLPDASLRGYDDHTEMGAPPEPDLVAAVAEHLGAELARTRPALVFAPLAVGGHVDHSAVRQAVSAVVGSAGVLWYEDLPYAGGSRTRHTEYPVVVDLAGHWAAKESGVHHYPSQLPHEVLPVLREHCAEAAGERLWADRAETAARLAGLLGLAAGQPGHGDRPQSGDDLRGHPECTRTAGYPALLISPSLTAEAVETTTYSRPSPVAVNADLPGRGWPTPGAGTAVEEVHR